MKNSQRWIGIVILLIAGLQLAACGGSPSAKASTDKPAYTEEIAGSEFKRVVLTEQAAQRTGIQTAPADQLVVPYAAVLYGLHGETWVYTSPAPLTYVREPIKVDRIDGDLAILSEGPEPGTEVVTVGVIELYGEETGIKK